VEGVLVSVTTAVPLQADSTRASTIHEARILLAINPDMRVLFSHSSLVKSWIHEKICEVPLI
jgi:hypothetical protein